jgi:hypothetical protein
MGQKRTAKEYFEMKDGAHEEEDCVVLEQDKPSQRYKLNQQEALDQWTM